VSITETTLTRLRNQSEDLVESRVGGFDPSAYAEYVDDPCGFIVDVLDGERIWSRQGRISKILFHYLVGTPERVRHFTEEHRLGLFTHDEMLGVFEAQDLSVEYDEEGLFGRGLYMANCGE
jgi:hypothetical protein